MVTSNITVTIIITLVNILVATTSEQLKDDSICCISQVRPMSCMFTGYDFIKVKGKSIYVANIFSGGLGNQLFEIFTTISYSLKYKIPCLFYYSNEEEQKVYRGSYWNTFYTNLKCLSTYNHPKYNKYILKLPKYNEKQYYYKPLLPPSDVTLLVKGHSFILNGYYQSYKYFNNYKHIIFNAISIYTIQNNIYQQYKHIYYQSDANNNNKVSVAMHFRLGDYRNASHMHLILPLEYYINSISYLLQSTSLTESDLRILCFYEGQNYDLYVCMHVCIVYKIYHMTNSYCV